MASRLEKALARFRRGGKAAQETVEPVRRRAGDTFRVRVEERLRNLEQQVNEIKGRVNGLIFLVAGTALTQVILKILQ